MKKTLNKALSLLLAILMIGGTMTTLAFAETDKTPYQEITSNLTEENRILYLENFDLTEGSDKDVINTGITVEKLEIIDPQYGTDARSHVEGNGIYCDLTSKEWYYEGIDTNLKLDADSKYTITLDVKENSAHKHMLGLGWIMPIHDTNQRRGRNSVGFTIHDQADGTQIANRNSGWSVDWSINIGGTDSTRKLGYNTKEGKLDQFINYIIVIDGYTASLYIDGTCVISNATVKTGYDTTLSIFCMNNTSEAASSNAADNTFGTDVVMEIKNIAVYETAELTKTVTNAEVGDELLHLDNFDLTDSTFTSDYDVAVTTATWSENDNEFTNSATVNGDVISSTRTTNNWYTLGVDTTLPLNENSTYTIEFYAKELMPHAIGFGWSNPSDETPNLMQAFHMLDRGAATNGYNTEIRRFDGAKGSAQITTSSQRWAAYNITEKHKDADGYVRYTITINGKNASLYVAGKLLVNNQAFTSVQSDHLSLFIKNWTAESTGNDYGGVSTSETHALGKDSGYCTGEAVSIKDITVYHGDCARTENNVTAVLLNGETQPITEITDNKITAFPNAGEVAEDEVLIWTYVKNGVKMVAEAPFEVTCDITFTAESVKKSQSEFVGVQYTTPTDNKQNIRLISTINSLEGQAVGFEVTAKYMDNGVLSEQSWDKNCTHVYSAIYETLESGITKTRTANELGGTYLVALAVEGVPTGIGQIDFYVRSYFVVNGEKVYDSEIENTFSMIDGKYVKGATPLVASAS